LIIILAKIAASLYRELGHELPSLEPISASVPESSTTSTGSSGPPPSASTTGSDGVSVDVPGDKLLTLEDARDLLARRKTET
jgi:hypothetical protein